MSMDHGPAGDDPIAWRALPRGIPVVGSDGQELGTVTDVLADDDKDIFHGLVVGAGGRDVLVRQEHVRRMGDARVDVDLAQRQLADLPTYDPGEKQPL